MVKREGEQGMLFSIGTNPLSVVLRLFFSRFSLAGQHPRDPGNGSNIYCRNNPITL